ncbi:MAG: hypothetical protein JWO15_3471 [Sphingomonadales bacterium]|nr:hypothetical protein [Sphingomonadales bacterium]
MPTDSSSDNQTPPEVDTSPEKLAELAKAENEAGIVDQQTASAAKPENTKDRW